MNDIVVVLTVRQIAAYKILIEAIKHVERGSWICADEFYTTNASDMQRLFRCLRNMEKEVKL